MSNENAALKNGQHSHSNQNVSRGQINKMPNNSITSTRTSLTPYERLNNDLNQDDKIQKEVSLGKRIGFYRIRGELGTGNFSQVKMGLHVLTKEKVAIKILDKTKLDQKTQRLLSREISSMEKLHHPNIIRLYEVVETLSKLHIVMEYAAGGELFTKISNEGKLSEQESRPLYAQVVAAVAHIHSKNIIHRDLKAENVFYAANGLAKVGDFGFSTVSKENETLNTFCGSPPYAAPELFKDEHYIGVTVDIWAMGIMLYFMVVGVMPFRADTVAKLKKCILDGNFTIPPFVSKDCQSLISGILKSEPSERLTIREMMTHPWLKGQEFPKSIDAYHTVPAFEKENATMDELKVLKELEELGIQEDLLKGTRDHESRNSITGTYRIVLHRLQRKYIEPPISTVVVNNSNPSSGKKDEKQKQRNKPSRTCHLL
ncbi:serine/threonine-protein kinase NIM1-like [Anneissia japonica]|uniref:serine/threonine-protein kinase NIM1-like n=1 Tax=Anneissia japonica TaxID=1529436 RepID=UPI001425B8FA|nr:serine/threonine-protein kinase NIM1-like [Anneissia japonica]XP_033113955.1 serine/threonine-protein kinase NIM1-like [Anneissia japonica]XP_033113957.1 serine/threonine-protein kinase NIM1-like [Anneissia japonica]